MYNLSKQKRMAGISKNQKVVTVCSKITRERKTAIYGIRIRKKKFRKPFLEVINRVAWVMPAEKKRLLKKNKCQ